MRTILLPPVDLTVPSVPAPNLNPPPRPPSVLGVFPRPPPRPPDPRPPSVLGVLPSPPPRPPPSPPRPPSPNLQIIFDPVNLLCVDNLAQQDEIIEKAFELLLKDIAVVHCKDYIVEGSELKSVAAGTGKGNPVTGGGLNYPLLLKKIKEHKPYVHCTLENTVPENAVATREFMTEYAVQERAAEQLHRII